MSRDTWLDILGSVLVILAVTTLLALFSAQRGAILGPWIHLLGRVFGWGVYFVPLFTGAVGLYLILRRFGDRIPRPQLEQVAGAGILFLVFLATAHFAGLWLTGLPPGAMAETGYGGGHLGRYLGTYLLEGLGGIGTALVLLALWLLGFLFTFGISPAEMVQGVMTWLRERRRIRPPIRSAAPSRSPSARPAAPAEQAPLPPPSPSSAPLPAPMVPAAPASVSLRPRVVGGGTAWALPPVDQILEPGSEQNLDQELIRQQVRIIEETLASLGAPVKVREINRGPVVTQFGVEPLFVANSRGKETRVKVAKIASLADDLALALSARTVRIQAPVPNKGLVGIEVPNEEVALVALRDIIESEAWERVSSPLRLGLGQDVSGAPYVADLRAMPHLLIAGTTGSGKSVCINAILTALLLQNTPDDLKLLMVDPKRVELTPYNGIPHLLAPVVVDMERVAGALGWVLREMDGRYRQFAAVGARDIGDYNERVVPTRPELKRIPYIVVVVDELADLMMLAPQETEKAICRLAQMARATGIHLIIATQRPSVDVVTGLIKANFPARIAFAVASSVDSRVILDMPGAERLLGRGDMLFMPPDSPQPIRLQGAFVSDAELQRLIRYWRGAAPPLSPVLPSVEEARPVQLPLRPDLVPPPARFEDDLIPDAVAVLLAENRASVSLLQRRLRIGYTRSARIIELLEEKGIVGPPQPGTQFREVNRAAAEALLRQAGMEPENSRPGSY
ncbi:MAG: DNA translocase FtsK 4TM domain-containing protein [Anaerolineae bacterium]|nr:DNA translocase FtsK [Anaerolineae bacterium]MDW8067835.1 DNA translocase FtsK 4TM domain-containing protein [Anaerolineae bacterium]